VLVNVPPQVTTYPHALEAIERRFPDGVSNHGAQYLAGWPQQLEDQASFVAEAVFEAVRLAERPGCPSRMVSFFASESVDDARAFVASYRRNVHVDIWRAEGEIVHKGNMALLNALALPVVAALERASAYWAGDRGPAPAMWELLVAPGLQLVEIVETTGDRITRMPGVGTVL
jgi:hypothetical protein